MGTGKMSLVRPPVSAASSVVFTELNSTQLKFIETR